MKRELTLRVDEQEMLVTVERQGDRLIVERDGERYEVTVVGNRLVSGAGHTESGPGMTARSVPAAPPTAPATLPPRGSESQRGVIRAPMVGVIRSIAANVGSVVGSGDVVVTLEAMKMDIPVAAPHAGTVISIAAAVGDNVREGDLLATLEPASEGHS